MSTSSNTALLPQKKSTNTNPFYKMGSTLTLLQQASKMTDKPVKSVLFTLINAAWKECNTTKEKKELFFTVLFSLGDITNREHNVFKKVGIKNPDQGGSSLRKVFLYSLEWMHANVPEQFYKFLPIYGEYYNLGATTMFHLLWTDRFKGNILENFYIPIDLDVLTDFIANSIKKADDNGKRLWAKWLWTIPDKTRTRRFVVSERGLKSVQKKYGEYYKVGDIVCGTRQKQAETRVKDSEVLNAIHLLSKKMDWAVMHGEKNGVKFSTPIGYKKFRSKYIIDTEAVMFSSQRIRTLSRIELLEWFDQLPSGACYRTQCRLLNKIDGSKLVPNEKWKSISGELIGNVFLGWLDIKEKAQQKLRSLSEEDREVLAKTEPESLKLMEKAAKVNTGATTLLDCICDFFKGGNNQEIGVKAQSILDKINIQVPVMVVADISGSMSNMALRHNDVAISANQLAALATTTFLLKNPNPELRDMFIRFDDKVEIIHKGQKAETRGSNKFLATANNIVGELTDRTQPFLTNYQSVAQYIITRGGTFFNNVVEELKKWTGTDSSKIEMVNQYPVWLVVSDGDMNGAHSAEATMREFQHKMKQYFGWEGVVVVWDVKSAGEIGNKFENLENVVYYGGTNPGVLNQIFTRIHDLDIIDVYTPLQSLHRSNRYQPVKDLVI